MSIETYQNVIIGSGEGGKYLAWHLAQSGHENLVIRISSTNLKVPKLSGWPLHFGGRFWARDL